MQFDPVKLLYFFIFIGNPRHGQCILLGPFPAGNRNSGSCASQPDMSELQKVDERSSYMEDRLYPKEPSFLAVVAISGVVLFFIFLGAMVLVDVAGSHMLPNYRKPDYEPTSMLVMPAQLQPTVSCMRV